MKRKHKPNNFFIFSSHQNKLTEPFKDKKYKTYYYKGCDRSLMVGPWPSKPVIGVRNQSLEGFDAFGENPRGRIMKELAKYNEPIKNNEITLLFIPVDKLEVIEFQRKPSNYHIKRLEKSMKTLGFIVPLIVVKKTNKFYIIDGQHRYLSAKNLNVKELPALVIPEKLLSKMMELNIEKQLSLREKSYVALNIYKEYLKNNEEMMEDNAIILDSIEYSYFITCGIAYEQHPRFYGSAFESVLKRIDTFLHMKLKDAKKEREKMAEALIELDALIRDVVEVLKNQGYYHPFIFKQIISYASPLGKKRKLETTFYDIIREIKKKIIMIKNKPELVRNE